MSSEPQISLCIPTRNRPAKLREILTTLAHELEGLSGEVEICVSDNSTNELTQGVLGQMATLFGSGLTYARTDGQSSFGENLRKVTQLARGRYIQYSGDDDQPVPGAILRLLEYAIQKRFDLIVNVSLPGDRLRKKPRAPEISFQTIGELGEIAGLFHYSFIGNIMLRRETALARLTDYAVTSVYPHCFLWPMRKDLTNLLTSIKLVIVDDSERSWRKWVWHFYGIDYARVMRASYEAGQMTYRQLTLARLKLLKSVPFAVLTEQSSTDRPGNKEWMSTRVSNLIAIYGPLSVVAVGLALASRLVPESIARRILARKNHRC